MKRQNVTDHRRIKMEDIVKSDFIPFLEGRPNRNTTINEDDYINLSIALNTSRSWEEFIKQL